MVGASRQTDHCGVELSTSVTTSVRLVPVELRLVEAALPGDDSLAEALGLAVVPGWVTFGGALERTRDVLASNPDGSAWGARFFVAGEPPELVGWGGFKGPPAGGVVEIGYEIAEARQGQVSRRRRPARWLRRRSPTSASRRSSPIRFPSATRRRAC
jgi:hypothetical protein